MENKKVWFVTGASKGFGLVIRKALPHMPKKQTGHIFNVSSIGGFTGKFPCGGIYCATKGLEQPIS